MSFMSLERVYLGTWQFESLDDAAAQGVLEEARKVGITKFDTAAVYAGGRSELLLGNFIRSNDTVVTKVPACSKEELAIENAYSEEHIAASLDGSIDRLGRPPDVALMHNWRCDWECEAGEEVLEKFRILASERAIGAVGISLSNGYNGEIEASGVFGSIQYLELPFNNESPLLSLDRIKGLQEAKQILVRSILKHGRDIDSMDDKFQAVLATGVSIVVGASRPEYINDWSAICQQNS